MGNLCILVWSFGSFGFAAYGWSVSGLITCGRKYYERHRWSECILANPLSELYSACKSPKPYPYPLDALLYTCSAIASYHCKDNTCPPMGTNYKMFSVYRYNEAVAKPTSRNAVCLSLILGFSLPSDSRCAVGKLSIFGIQYTRSSDLMHAQRMQDRKPVHQLYSSTSLILVLWVTIRPEKPYWSPNVEDTRCCAPLPRIDSENLTLDLRL